MFFLPHIHGLDIFLRTRMPTRELKLTVKSNRRDTKKIVDFRNKTPSTTTSTPTKNQPSNPPQLWEGIRTYVTLIQADNETGTFLRHFFELLNFLVEK